MCNSAFPRIVVRDTVIIVYQLFAASVCGGCNDWFAFAPADNFYTAMIDCYKNSSFLPQQYYTWYFVSNLFWYKISSQQNSFCENCFDAIRKFYFAYSTKGYGENAVCPIMKTNAKRWFVFIRPRQSAHTCKVYKCALVKTRDCPRPPYAPVNS